MCWFLETECGKAKNFETVAYIGNPDARYHVLAMAAAKTGFKVRSRAGGVSLYRNLALGLGTIFLSPKQSC